MDQPSPQPAAPARVLAGAAGWGAGRLLRQLEVDRVLARLDPRLQRRRLRPGVAVGQTVRRRLARLVELRLGPRGTGPVFARRYAIEHRLSAVPVGPRSLSPGGRPSRLLRPPFVSGVYI